MKETTRRDFLKAAGLAAAGIAGAVPASLSYAQQTDDEKKKDDKKKGEPEEDELFGDSEADSAEEETRACPQCGALMYKQGNTWTCETCGYSYVE